MRPPNWLFTAHKLILPLTGAFFLAFHAPIAHADLIETFSYSNGNLTTVSSNAWQLWQAGTGNATVLSGTPRLTDSTDVIRLFPAVLTARGATAIFSFSINVNALSSTTEGYVVSLQPASAPFGSLNTDYGSVIGLGFYGSGTSGTSALKVFEGDGGSTFFVVDAGTMTAGVSHTIDFRLSRATLPNVFPNSSYSLSVDGIFRRSGAFNMSDARGLNSVEMNHDGNPNASGFALVDNISVVPEPGTSVMLAIGAVLFLSFPRPRLRRFAWRGVVGVFDMRGRLSKTV